MPRGVDSETRVINGFIHQNARSVRSQAREENARLLRALTNIWMREASARESVLMAIRVDNRVRMALKRGTSRFTGIYMPSAFGVVSFSSSSTHNSGRCAS